MRKLNYWFYAFWWLEKDEKNSIDVEAMEQCQRDTNGWAKLRGERVLYWRSKSTWFPCLTLVCLKIIIVIIETFCSALTRKMPFSISHNALHFNRNISNGNKILILIMWIIYVTYSMLLNCLDNDYFNEKSLCARLWWELSYFWTSNQSRMPFIFCVFRATNYQIDWYISMIWWMISYDLWSKIKLSISFERYIHRYSVEKSKESAPC